MIGYTPTETAYNRELWAAALESGGFLQGVNALVTVPSNPRHREKHCCLGVACEVAAASGVIPKRRARSRYFDGEAMLLPVTVQHWLGLRSVAAPLREKQRLSSRTGARVPCETLCDVNDIGRRFSEIAAMIRDNRLELIHDYADEG